jgi:crotonobetainyl-CoA:carnitine CoA-transferase CaiB-like acyl-CoA transferase
VANHGSPTYPGRPTRRITRSAMLWAEHADELDAAVAAWVGERTRAEVLEGFEKAEAAAAPVYDVADIMADPQLAALDAITTVQDPDFGPLRMQNVLFRLSGTPGELRWTGRSHGADTDRVLGSLGLTADEIAALRDRGVV